MVSRVNTLVSTVKKVNTAVSMVSRFRELVSECYNGSIQRLV